MRVPAHENVGVDRPEQLDELVVGREPRVDRLVRQRCRVAEEHAPESVDVELQRQRGQSAIAASRASPSRRRSRSSPRRVLVGGPRSRRVDRRSRGRKRTRFEDARRDRRPRPSNGPLTSIAADDDRIDRPAARCSTATADEGREVAVDVADRGDAHGREASARDREARPARRRDRAPGSPRRRTRSASAGSRLRGCARSPPRAASRAFGTSACVKRRRRRRRPAARETGTRPRRSLAPARRQTERVDEPLQHVLGLDDLGRRPALERVRLVVDDERLLALPPEDVEPAADDDAVVLEGERPLGPSAASAATPSARGRTRSRRRRVRRSDRAPRPAPPGTTRARCRSSSSSRRRHRIVERRRCSSSRWTASPISVRGQPPCPSRRQTRAGDAAAARERARRSSGTSSARRARARCTTAAERRAPAAPGSSASGGSSMPSRGRAGRKLAEAARAAARIRVVGLLDSPSARGAYRLTERTKRASPRSSSIGVSPASATASCASSRSSTQPIGVVSVGRASGVDRAGDDQTVDRPRHRDVVETKPLGLAPARAPPRAPRPKPNTGLRLPPRVRPCGTRSARPRARRSRPARAAADVAPCVRDDHDLELEPLAAWIVSSRTAPPPSSSATASSSSRAERTPARARSGRSPRCRRRGSPRSRAQGARACAGSRSAAPPSQRASTARS
mgnify:CR=1 FL=1